MLRSNDYSASEQGDGDTDGTNKAECVGHTGDRKEDGDRPEDGDGYNDVNVENFISMLDTQ